MRLRLSGCSEGCVARRRRTPPSRHYRREMARPSPLPIDPLAEAKRQWLAHGWTDAADGMALVTSVMRAQQLLLARVDATLKPFALSFARYEVLRLLASAARGAFRFRAWSPDCRCTRPRSRARRSGWCATA